MDVIKALDIYVGNAKLYYKGKTGPRTILGSLITILLTFIFILLVLSFGNDFFYRLNPSFLSQDINPANYTNYNITLKDFPFSFRFEDSYGKLVDPELKYFYFEVKYERYQRQDGNLELITTENLPYSLCKKEYFQEGDLFETKGMSKFYCIDFSQVNYLNFGGGWDGDFVNLIYIEYLKCNSGDVNHLNQPCGSTEMNNELVSNLYYVSLLLPQIMVDPSNYSNPFTKDLKSIYSLID